MAQYDTQGGAVDLDMRRRPGVPMELTPEPLPGARTPIEPQRSGVKVLKDPERKHLPPVYGTAQPPAGLSGLLRRLAYRYPVNRARRWLMLMLADRVDVAEHSRDSSLRVGTLLAGGLLAGGLMLKRAFR